ncbi:MAG: replication factor C small subunit [Candidatus Aenigmarchaeota archaeon]|nr:replication factor C small subunit [Candidatus Aenigmarchaeota archaeon]
MAGIEIWTEKYRPNRLDDIVNQKHVKERLRSWTTEGSIPHLIFAGPAGTGKTTTAIAVARELFGNDWKENFLELNASDERGIDVVRVRIKNYARTKSLASKFRIIFLDESDALTPEAQQALRRTIEQFSSACRFILSCNYSSRIIEPIQSRAAVFRFRKLAQEDVAEYLKRIAMHEKLEVEKGCFEAIFDVSEGDMRKATNLLQTAAAKGKVTAKAIYEISGQIESGAVRKMLDAALAGKFAEARKLLHELMISNGLAAEDMVKGIHREIYSLDIQESQKLLLIEKLGDYEFRINQGATPEIQLEALLSHFAKVKA